MTDPVRREITVKVPVERAWQVYTAGYGSWYPKDHFLGDGPAETVEIEPHAGGRWFERHADGTELLWGRVKEWEPPHRLLLSWMVGGDWKCDPDESHASEIEVTFTAVDAGTTEVVLEHRDLDKHGDGAGSLVQGVADDDMGHLHYLRRFAAAAEERPA
jgi:uncharacterized protein YndB with AHSA1/START domain